MKTAMRFLPACLLAASVMGWYGGGLGGRASAQETGKAQSLFNGKDLTGWVTPDDKAIFSVENGEIVGRTQGNLKKNEFLVTEKPYRDFVLKAKVKFRNGNSGIQFRARLPICRERDGLVRGRPGRNHRPAWLRSSRFRTPQHLRETPRATGNADRHERDWSA